MDSRPNLVVTGFMGVGKSKVGASVADRLGRPFVDMDREIESRVCKSIADIFAQDGEDAFRNLEAEVCREVSDRDGVVIATGGGTFVDPENRDRLLQSGTVVCLTCEPEELARRLSKTEARPLLRSADPQTTIVDLLESRREAYAGLPWHIDTTTRSIEDIVEDVVRLASSRTLSVRRGDTTYPIRIGPGLLAHLGDAVRAAGLAVGTRVVIVTNPVVDPLYGSAAAASLRDAGYEVGTCIIPDGEHYKTLDTVRAIYDTLLQQGLDRGGALLSLGGGVTGDIAGFAAATFLRGVRFIQVPTTLLSMVDSSVGGKTGVNLPEGKNLVGAFKCPDLVVIDPQVLKTLPDEEIRSGLAEVIKHGILGDPTLFAELEESPLDRASWGTAAAADRIARALGVKIRVVERDPLERGNRVILNLGHTVGHALEMLSGYELRHGEAVAIGLVAAARLGSKRGLATPLLVETIERILGRNGLPTDCPAYRVDEIETAMGRDKKRAAGVLRWVIPQGIGDVTVTDDVPIGLVREVLREMGARSE
ncbi:MAG: 3-dehydroquinate synthase [Candidatus Bipolaricaulia bacterium]